MVPGQDQTVTFYKLVCLKQMHKDDCVGCVAAAL